MAEPALATSFASPERIDEQELVRLHGMLATDTGLCTIVDAMPELVMVLGESRQILLGNRALRDFASSQGCDDLLGLRPGELLSCRNALSAPSGCGTDEACSMCGAVEAILTALHGDRASFECRLLRQLPHGIEALDLRVCGTPFLWHGEQLALVVVVDISDEKRRKVLERIFFHDILNTAGAINSLTELLADGILTFDQARESLVDSARALVGEIREQRELLAAESNELTVKPTPVHSRLFLEGVIGTYRHTHLGRERELRLDQPLAEAIIFSDERLLGRVVGNLVKNALEAVSEGGVVTLGCIRKGEEIVFWCHNAGEIPREAKLQIFQRSFSTKEPGRGIGTYGVKLLTERYLKGRAAFVSSPSTGTTFSVSLPLDIRH